MYPPTHVALTYLVGRKALPHPVTGFDVWFLGICALLPDIADKTFHYYFGWFTSGRNVFHNVFIVLISYVVYRYGVPERWKRLALIFLLGLTTHFVGDLFPALIRWTYIDYSSVSDWYLYIFFPLYDPRLLPIKMDWFEFAWELVLTLVIIRIWFKDGGPGIFKASFKKKRITGNN